MCMHACTCWCMRIVLCVLYACLTRISVGSWCIAMKWLRASIVVRNQVKSGLYCPMTVTNVPITYLKRRQGKRVQSRWY